MTESPLHKVLRLAGAGWIPTPAWKKGQTEWKAKGEAAWGKKRQDWPADHDVEHHLNTAHGVNTAPRSRSGLPGKSSSAAELHERHKYIHSSGVLNNHVHGVSFNAQNAPGHSAARQFQEMNNSMRPGDYAKVKTPPPGRGGGQV